MDKKKSMYIFIICFTFGSVVLFVDGYNYYLDSMVESTDFCACVHEELKPYLCPIRFNPLSSFSFANYFYFFGVIGLMLYKDVPSLTDIVVLLKNKYKQRNK